MPSFDIINKVDLQKVDNGINVAVKELATRYDLKDSSPEIEFDKKQQLLRISAGNEMGVDTIIDIVMARLNKQGIDPKAMDLSKAPFPSGKLVKKEIPLKAGIEKEAAKKIVKIIKDSGLKVEAAIMGDQVRVSGKKIDDLQAVMALLRRTELEIPVQFDNMRS